MGKPDGMCIDQSGMLWVGMWGGAAVRRWNPATGEQIGQIDLPVSNVTSCCFGGSQLDKLYITTAQIGLPPDQHKAQPNAGALFACDVGIVGLPSHPFPLT